MRRLTVAALAFVASSSHAALIFNVGFTDPGNTFASFYQPITSAIQGAGSIWSSHLAGNASLEVTVSFTDVSTANGGSVTANFLRYAGNGLPVFEQGAASEIRTGIDPNGSSPDIQFQFGKSFLQNALWFDPNPFTRTTPVPFGKTDAVSTVLHELGHALAFNGYLNGITGANPGSLSTYDEWVTHTANGFFFNGPNAEAVYGGPVPLTNSGFYQHLGNSFGPGSELVPFDLMNGGGFLTGYKYDPSALDLAIFADVGFNLITQQIPEPGTLGITLLGLLILLMLLVRRKLQEFFPHTTL